MVKRSASLGYGIGDNLIALAPVPIVAKRDPTNRDLAEIGTLWVNTVSQVIFGLASVTGNLANWTSTPAAGATTLASLLVNPGNATITAGNLTVSAGNLRLLRNSSYRWKCNLGAALSVKDFHFGSAVKSNKLAISENLTVTGLATS